VRLPVRIADFARLMAAKGLRPGDINAFVEVEPRFSSRVPFATAKVPAGFPSPADYMERPLDFNELLIENPAATFAVRVDGDSIVSYTNSKRSPASLNVHAICLAEKDASPRQNPLRGCCSSLSFCDCAS
jgi:hypothetical protein